MDRISAKLRLSVVRAPVCLLLLLCSPPVCGLFIITSVEERMRMQTGFFTVELCRSVLYLMSFSFHHHLMLFIIHTVRMHLKNLFLLYDDFFHSFYEVTVKTAVV